MKKVSYFAFALLFAGALACQNQNSAEDKMDEAGDKVEEAADETGEAIEEGAEETEDAAEEMGDEMDGGNK